MSVHRIHLRKLLRAFGDTKVKKITLLRNDIRTERKKLSGNKSGGGDFYAPFWCDAKNHASGEIDLNLATLGRIAKNERRSHLYPELNKGFLNWWHLKRRNRNVPVTAFPYSVKERYDFVNLNALVKVENLLTILIGDPKNGPQEKRLIYPYFTKKPELSDDIARLGLWLLRETLTEYDPTDLRILDVMRSKTFSIADTPLRGTEESEFTERYASILYEWQELYKQYG